MFGKNPDFTMTQLETYAPEDETKLERLEKAITTLETQLNFNQSRLNLPPPDQRPGMIEAELLREENGKIRELIQRCKEAREVLSAQERPENDVNYLLDTDRRLAEQVQKRAYRNGVVNKQAVQELKNIENRIRKHQLTKKEAIKNENLLKFQRYEDQIIIMPEKLTPFLDVLILVEIFKAFRYECMANFELEPAHFLSLPSFAYQVYNNLIILCTNQTSDSFHSFYFNQAFLKKDPSKVRIYQG